MAYTNNAFCWHGIVTTDIEKAKTFYSEVLGWSVQTMQMGDEEAIMFSVGGIPRAHLRGPNMPGEPPHWDNYLRVEDVDASTALCVTNGGRQIVPPTDIPPGRFSVIAGPSGAILSLFHEVDPENSTNPPSGNGTIHWVELQSTDIDADRAWLTSSFGFEMGEMPMPQGGTYYLLKDGEEMRGGACPAFQEGAPSHWLTWVEIDDVDAAAARVKQFGGQTFTDIMDMPNVGRMVVVADSTGGVFGIITPAQPA